MSESYRPNSCFVRSLLGMFLLAHPAALTAQVVPPALESPPAQTPQTGSNGEKLPGMHQISRSRAL